MNRILRWNAVLFAVAMQACQDLTSSQTLGNGAVNPEEVKTAAAAYGIARSAHVAFQYAFSKFIVVSGLLTDELQSNNRGGTATPLSGPAQAEPDVLIDARYTSTDATGVSGSLYAQLHQVRGLAIQGIGALSRYAGDSSAVQRAILYAFAGYAEVMLADIYCSGIPLSTWDFERDFTYQPGSTTRDVYRHAVALFDTAISLSADSTQIQHLASVGKGRALVALEEFERARMAVQDVPSDFVYTELVFTCSNPGVGCRNATAPAASTVWFDLSKVSVSVGEGGSVITPENPRTFATIIDTTRYNFPVYFPARYARNAVNPLIVASGLEAALIRAEAALQADDIAGWLAQLNALRAAHPVTDTMQALTDPGVETRMDMMLAERAQWLFLTGHRQGDLRRLLRRYPSRIPSEVYPSGGYPGGIVLYGREVTLPIDIADEGANPHFRACTDRRA